MLPPNTACTRTRGGFAYPPGIQRQKRDSIFGFYPLNPPRAGKASRWAARSFSRFTIFLAVALSKFIRHKRLAGVRACSVALQAFRVWAVSVFG